MTKFETLQDAFKARKDEVLSYQVNIDNYIRAIAKINAEHENNVAMVQFRDQLTELLASSKTEQLKASIIRDVIADQITELEAS